jgi:hypothetical protein
MNKLALLIAVAMIFWMASCSGAAPSTVTSVVPICSLAGTNIQSNQVLQCYATVNGTGTFETTVTWAATAGTINDIGTFTAPVVTTPQTLTVTATSTQTPSVSGTTTITVDPVNLQPLIVDNGPQPQNFTTVNQAFATVTVCMPGTQTCQSIDHVLVDTGSSGLRLLSTVLTVPLPQQNDSSGNPLDECHIFADGYGWGPVSAADVSIAGEIGPSTPVQVLIPSTGSPAVPAACSSQTTGPNEGDSVSALGANGVLGIGLFQQDCGATCTSSNGTIPPIYFDCPASGCNPTYVTLAQQVPNPVSLFLTDNNGSVISLPSVPPQGLSNVSGSLIFGIGTQGNNALQNATIYTVPNSGSNAGEITTMFNGTSYPAVIDSSADAILFLDATTTGLPTCTVQTLTWYCPTSPANFTATNQGTNGSQGTVNFSIGNASTLLTSGNTAFSTLGAPLPGAFDWGLSFFFNRVVFTAIENQSTPGGTGPYIAY